MSTCASRYSIETGAEGLFIVDLLAPCQRTLVTVAIASLPPSDSDQPTRHRVGAFLKHWWPIAAGVLGTALLTIGGVSPDATFELGGDTDHWVPFLIGGGLLLLALGAVSGGVRQLHLDRLQRERAEFKEDAEAGARALLRLVFHELEQLRNAAGHFSNERVTLFRCDEEGFILLGRRSARPDYDYARCPGRARYPEDQGCLALAWKDGRSEQTTLPPAGQAKPWSEDWVQAQAELGVPRATAEALTMPSCSYLAYRIEGRERSLGVIVFESINTSSQAEQLKSTAALTSETLDPIQKSGSGRLANLLRESEFIPAATVAALLPGIRD
jgi:hypothetical protein